MKMKLSMIFKVVVLSLGTVSTVSAQDVLVTQQGDVHKVYEIEIGGSSIFYKLENTPNATIQKIDKSQVLMIKYQDGRKEIIGEEKKSSWAPALQEPIKSSKSDEGENEADNEANKQKIEAFNQTQQISYIGSRKKKKAKFIYGLFNVKSDSKLEDKNVEISVITVRANEAETSRAYLSHVHTRGGTPTHNGIVVSVKNKTDKTIYLDLGNTFFMRNNSPSPYYIPSATQITSGTSTGASVNMGAVANALGVGGTIGTLANGVNVGGGTLNSSSTITYAQRVIPVPAHSTKKLDLQLLFPENLTKIYGSKFIHQTNHRLHCLFDKEEIIKIGEERLFTETDSPIQWGVHLIYDTSENITSPKKLSASFYVSKMIGCKYSMMHSFDGAITKGQLPEIYRDLVSFVAWQGR